MIKSRLFMDTTKGSRLEIGRHKSFREGRLTVHVSIYTSKEAITKLKLEKDRRKILEHKAETHTDGE